MVWRPSGPAQAGARKDFLGSGVQQPIGPEALRSCDFAREAECLIGAFFQTFRSFMAVYSWQMGFGIERTSLVCFCVCFYPAEWRGWKTKQGEWEKREKRIISNETTIEQ